MYWKNGYSTFDWDNKCDFLVIVAPAMSLGGGLWNHTIDGWYDETLKDLSDWCYYVEMDPRD